MCPMHVQRTALRKTVTITPPIARPSGDGGASWISSTAGKNSTSKPFADSANPERVRCTHADLHARTCRDTVLSDGIRALLMLDQPRIVAVVFQQVIMRPVFD